MLKILLVEDEAEKRRLIIEAALEEPTLTVDDIVIVGDAHAAKLALQGRKFDLVILDINIPSRSDRRPETGKGLDVLHFIRTNVKAISPTYIVGMSAYEDALRTASEDFKSLLWKLVPFSYEDPLWRDSLKDAISYLIEHNSPPYSSDGVTYHTDLGVVVALEEAELESIRALDANWRPIRIPFDDSRYFRGTFRLGDVALDVVAVAAPKMGMSASAVVTTKLINAFRPRYLAMTGICAGVRGRTEIGDILVADPCFDWGSGKWVQVPGGDGIRFRPAPYPWRLEEAIRTAIVRVSEDKELLRSIYDSFMGKKAESPPRVMVEAMASGGSVLQASRLMSDVQDQHKNLIGVEMESYAIFTAAQYCTAPRPTVFSVKAVCDFGDDSKCDDFHRYAAHNSAKFLYHFALAELRSC